MTKNISVKQLVLLGLFSAIIILQTFTPMLGYVKFFGVVDFTIVHITTIIGACLLQSVVLGGVLGGIWGVTSMLYAYSTAGILNPLFYNPMISVVPRILVGMIASGLFIMLSKKFNTVISGVVSAIFGTLTNTILVLSGFYLFGYQIISTAFKLNASSTGTDPVVAVILSLIGTNTLAEIIAAAIIVPVIIVPLHKLMKRIK